MTITRQERVSTTATVRALTEDQRAHVVRRLDAAFASRDSRILAEIDDALRRFYRDPGGFGVDEGTGAPIAFERLDIIPWTRRA
jgi:RNA polymerase-binding transcription factor DksA